MDKNTLTGSLLIGLLFVVYITYINQQQKKFEEQNPDLFKQEQADSLRRNVPQADIPETSTGDFNGEISEPDKAATDSVSHHDLAKAKFGAFHEAAAGEEQFITIENELLEIRLSSKGGAISEVRLKEFKKYDGSPLVLSSPETRQFGYNFFINNNRKINTSEFYFEPDRETGFVVSDDESQSISMRLYAGSDKYIEQRYTLKGNSYQVDYDLRLVGLDDVIAANSASINLFWKEQIQQLEKDLETERRYSSVYYRYRDDAVEYLGLMKADQTLKESFKTSVDWISFKRQFFNNTLLLDGVRDGLTGSIESYFQTADTNYLKQYEASINLPYRPAAEIEYSLGFYMGPNNYRDLKKLGSGMEDLIQLSADFFLFKWTAVVSKWIIIPMFSFLERYVSSYGVIILILTLLLKLVLSPLTFKSYQSSAKMKLLKPELEALKEKFKNDQQKIGAEQIKLYQSAGVNPLGGCLPMLLQMPILIAMYYFFPASIELRQESFLWANDLSTYDSILDLPFTIPMYGSHVSLFTLLMTVSSVLYSVMNAQMTNMGGGGPNEKMMKYMPYVFPFFLMFIFNSWSAALTYYYFLSNIISFGQQFAIKKFFIDEEALHRKIQENRKRGPKKSGFVAKLEKRAKEREKQMRELRKQQGKKKK